MEADDPERVVASDGEDDADDVQGAGVVMPMAMLSGNGVAEKSLGRVPGADSGTRAPA